MASVAAGLSGMGHGASLLPKLEEHGRVDRIQREIYEQVRAHAGRSECPSVVIMEGQSVKTRNVVAFADSMDTNV